VLLQHLVNHFDGHEIFEFEQDSHMFLDVNLQSGPANASLTRAQAKYEVLRAMRQGMTAFSRNAGYEAGSQVKTQIFATIEVLAVSDPNSVTWVLEDLSSSIPRSSKVWLLGGIPTALHTIACTSANFQLVAATLALLADIIDHHRPNGCSFEDMPFEPLRDICLRNAGSPASVIERAVLLWAQLLDQQIGQHGWYENVTREVLCLLAFLGFMLDENNVRNPLQP
jgi:hypothetical protein